MELFESPPERSAKKKYSVILPDNDELSPEINRSYL